jgi:hypothetical protein
MAIRIGENITAELPHGWVTVPPTSVRTDCRNHIRFGRSGRVAAALDLPLKVLVRADGLTTNTS